MIDIRARLNVVEIIGMDAATKKINHAFDTLDTSKLTKYIEELEDLYTAPQKAGEALEDTIKRQERALKSLLSVQQKLSKIQSADNRRGQIADDKQTEEIQKRRSRLLKSRLQSEVNAEISARKTSAERLKQLNPLSTENIRRQEGENKKYSNLIKTRLRTIAAQEDQSYVRRERSRQSDLNKEIDVSESYRQYHKKQADEKAKIDKQSQDEYKAYLNEQSKELEKQRQKVDLLNKLNVASAKSSSRSRREAIKAQRDEQVENARITKADRRGDIQAIELRAANQAEKELQLQKSITLEQEKRLSVVKAISDQQAAIAKETQRLTNLDRQHNELADEYNKRVGRQEIQPSSLAANFTAQTSSITGQDASKLADKLMTDPAFIAEFNKNLTERVGKSTNADFNKRQQIKSAGIAAQNLAVSLSGGFGGKGGGGGPPGIAPPNFGQPNDPFRKAKDNIKEMKKALDTSTNSLNSFGSAAGLALRRFLAFQVGAQALYAVVGLFAEGARQAVQFEAELTKIQQTLDETDRGVVNLSDSIRSFSREVGVSAVEIAQGVRTFAQAGFDQVSELQQVSSLISRIPLSTSFDNINETVEGSIAILGQFGGGLENLSHIFDVTNQFAKDFAVEAQDIFAAVKRAGSSFSIAGGNIEEFVALLSVLREATRESGEVLGTFFKTGINQLFRPQSQQQLKQLGVNTSDTLINQLTQLGKTLFSEDSKFDSLQVLEVVRTLVDDSRQFPRLLALVRELANDKTQNKIQAALNQSSGSFIKDTETRIDDFGVSLKRAGQQIIDLFNEIISNPAIKQLAKDFADLTENILKLRTVAGPILPTLFATGAGIAFPTVRREVGNAARFIRGFGFARRGAQGSVSGGVNTNRSGGTLSEQLTNAEEGFVPLTKRQAITLGVGAGVTGLSALTRKLSGDDEIKKYAGVIENAGLAFITLISLGVNPLLAGLTGLTVGIKSLSDSIVKARKEAFESSFKNIKNPTERIQALLNNDFDPLSGLGQEESLVTQLINFPGRFYRMGINSFGRRFNDPSNTEETADLLNSDRLGFLSGSEKSLAAQEDLLRRVRSPSDRVGSGINSELTKVANSIFTKELDAGGTTEEVNRRARFALIKYIQKVFTQLDASGASELANTILQNKDVKKVTSGDLLLKPAQEFADAIRLFLNSFADFTRDLSDRFNLVKERFGTASSLRSDNLNVSNVSRFDIQNTDIGKNIVGIFADVPNIFKEAMSNSGFRNLLRTSTSADGVDEEVLPIRQRLSENLRLGNNSNNNLQNFLEKSFGPALVSLSKLSGKSEEDIVKSLLDNTDGFIDFVNEFSSGLGDGADVITKLTSLYNEQIAVINAQLDAQRKLNAESVTLRDSIFSLQKSIFDITNDIKSSDLEQSQLVSGRSDLTAIAQSILGSTFKSGNTGQLISQAESSRDALNAAFSDALNANLQSSDVNDRTKATENLLKAQNDYALIQQKVNQQSTILENNLSIVSRATNIFKEQLLALRGTVDSAGKTISGLEKKDLQSIIVSIGKFASASDGFVNISQGLTKLNPKEFDFVQKGLEIFNNFKLPGGLSGSDVLQDINKALGVPALASILRAASGGKLSQSEAEDQINQQIADALAKQSESQQQEKAIREQMVSLLEFQLQDKQQQLTALEKQSTILQTISGDITKFGNVSETLSGINSVVSQLFGSVPQPVKIVENTINTPLTKEESEQDVINRNLEKIKKGTTPNISMSYSNGPQNTTMENYDDPETPLDRYRNFNRELGFKVLSLIPGFNTYKNVSDQRDKLQSSGFLSQNSDTNTYIKSTNQLTQDRDEIRRNRIRNMVKQDPRLLPYIDKDIAEEMVREDPNIIQTPAAKRKFGNLTASKSNTNNTISGGSSVDIDKLNSINEHLSKMSESMEAARAILEKIANVPAIQMSLEIKPMQVNVNVSVPDLLRLAGPRIASEVISRVAPAISEAFGVVSDEAKSKFDSGISSQGNSAPEVD